jgi:hypothetical protein
MRCPRSSGPGLLASAGPSTTPGPTHHATNAGGCQPEVGTRAASHRTRAPRRLPRRLPRRSRRSGPRRLRAPIGTRPAGQHRQGRTVHQPDAGARRHASGRTEAGTDDRERRSPNDETGHAPGECAGENGSADDQWRRSPRFSHTYLALSERSILVELTLKSAGDPRPAPVSCWARRV